jgi:hypothetical protein
LEMFEVITPSFMMILNKQNYIVRWVCIAHYVSRRVAEVYL